MEEYYGNIYMIVGIDSQVLEYFKTHDSIHDEILYACKIVLAKENASLIKFNNNCYVDSDYIKSYSDFNKILDMVNNKATSNILMEKHVINPFTGQLFVNDLVKKKEISKKYTLN